MSAKAKKSNTVVQIKAMAIGMYIMASIGAFGYTYVDVFGSPIQTKEQPQQVAFDGRVSIVDTASVDMYEYGQVAKKPVPVPPRGQ